MTSFAFGAGTLDWEVEKKQLLFLNHKGEVTPCANKFALTRSDTEAVLGVVGENYEVFQNSSVFEYVAPLVEEGLLTFANQGYLGGGKKVFVQLEVAEEFEVVGEKTKGLLTLLTSHDGTGAVALGSTFVRVVCQNSFTTCYKQLREKFSHREGVTEQVLASRVAVDFVNANLAAYSKHCETLASAKCSVGQFHTAVGEVFGKPTTELRDSFVSQLETLFRSGKGNSGKTMYDAFNAVTEYATHFSRKSVAGRYNYANFGKGADINRRAMAVLNEMATV